jgi:hypothetical protein
MVTLTVTTQLAPDRKDLTGRLTWQVATVASVTEETTRCGPALI